MPLDAILDVVAAGRASEVRSVLASSRLDARLACIVTVSMLPLVRIAKE